MRARENSYSSDCNPNVTFVERGEMPPPSAEKQPSPERRAEFLKIVRLVLDQEARSSLYDSRRTVKK